MVEPETFEKAHANDPLGARFLSKVEQVLIGVGVIASSAAGLWSVEAGVGCALGWATFQLNVAVVRRLMARIFRAGSLSHASLALLMVKSIVLMVAIWLALTWLPASVEAFALGFTASLAGLVIGSVLLARRQNGEGLETDEKHPPSEPSE